MKMLVMDLGSLAIEKDKKDERKKVLVEYLTKSLHRH